jgi:amino acid transporter
MLKWSLWSMSFTFFMIVLFRALWRKPLFKAMAKRVWSDMRDYVIGFCWVVAYFAVIFGTAMLITDRRDGAYVGALLVSFLCWSVAIVIVIKAWGYFSGVINDEKYRIQQKEERVKRHLANGHNVECSNTDGECLPDCPANLDNKHRRTRRG